MLKRNIAVIYLLIVVVCLGCQRTEQIESFNNNDLLKFTPLQPNTISRLKIQSIAVREVIEGGVSVIYITNGTKTTVWSIGTPEFSQYSGTDMPISMGSTVSNDAYTVSSETAVKQPTPFPIAPIAQGFYTRTDALGLPASPWRLPTRDDFQDLINVSFNLGRDPYQVINFTNTDGVQIKTSTSQVQTWDVTNLGGSNFWLQDQINSNTFLLATRKPDGTTGLTETQIPTKAHVLFVRVIDGTDGSLPKLGALNLAISQGNSSSAICTSHVDADGGLAVTERGVCWGSSSNPTINNSRTLDGAGTGSFGSTITNLVSGTKYYARSYAKNSAGVAYSEEVTFTTTGTIVNSLGSVEYFGETYHLVSIGTQIWFSENLRTTKFNDGTEIPNISTTANWLSATTPAYCSYNNTSNVNFIKENGYLYNRYVAFSTKNVCPVDYRVATYDDWEQLKTTVGDNFDNLIETGTTHWIFTTANANNKYGFTALPSGMMYKDGSFVAQGTYTQWWTGTKDYNADNTNYIILNNSNPNYYNISKRGLPPNDKYGLSIRCIKGDRKQKK